MNSITKSLCLLGAVSVLTASAYADASIVGNYQCQRTDASGSANSYGLTVKASGDTYAFEWDNSSGYPQVYGTGVVHSKMPNAASVSFWDAKDSNNYGVEFFSVKSDGSMSGTWAVQSANQTGSDSCTKSK